MTRTIGSGPRSQKERMPSFDDLSSERREAIDRTTKQFGIRDCAKLHDEWMDVLRDHEALRWGESQAMGAVAKKDAEPRLLSSFQNLIAKSALALNDFSAIEDRAFIEGVKDFHKQAPAPVQASESLEQKAELLLWLISDLAAPLGYTSSASGSKANTGRPKITSRHMTADRLLEVWMSLDLPVPSRGERSSPLLACFDVTSRDVEFRFHAGWSAHALSRRWPESDKQIMFSLEEFSSELPLLRRILSKRARESGQSYLREKSM